LKIPLNGGFTCPNRDGSLGEGGCIFCDNQAFSPVALSSESIAAQLERGIERSPEKYQKFIAYFQPYSNTYGPIDKLKDVWEPAADHAKVAGLAIGTRPDCFSADVYDYLEALSKRTYISVELGIQTIHDRTLQRINSCRTYADGVGAIEELNKRGIEIVVHCMLGLPGETREMMMETAQFIAEFPVQGVKLHQLMVIRGTELGNLYSCDEVEVLSLKEYAELAAGFVARLRKDQCIHRLMADCLPPAELLAPLWSKERQKSYNYIRKTINRSLQEH
jgi:radical SAM protein (TIGR01212 family)